MDAKKYISLWYGGKEEAISALEKVIKLYDNDRRKTNKVLNRIEEYKKLLEEIKSLPDE
jgi:hypothetical protein